MAAAKTAVLTWDEVNTMAPGQIIGENIVCKETLWIPRLAMLCHTEWLDWILAQRPNSETSTGTTHGGVVHSDYLLEVAT